jgi:3-oxoacyl-[acyl-carrier protein] reductase
MSTMDTPQRRLALVTGATRGIGRAIAVALGRAGNVVVGTATSEAGAQAISQYLAETGLAGVGAVLNVTAAAAIEATLDAIQKQHGDIAILVNNAGITRDMLLLRMKDEDWDAVLDTNLKSVFRLSKAVLRPMMKARYGRIVNIGSVVGSTGNPGQLNYVAAKAGLAGLTKALALEVGSRNITVNCVAPGFIDTDMTRVLPEEQKTKLLERIPLGRLGRSEDVAEAVAYLASERAAYVTGTTLHVNGGMFMN